MKIILADGRTLEAPEAKPFDIVAFERKYKMSASQLGDNPHIEHALFLAWSSLRRTGQYADDFEKFIGEVDDFENEDDAAPLEVAQPTSNG